MSLTGDNYRLLHQRTDEVLHYVWDPIGSAHHPEARDEYSGYVPHVVGLLASGADEETVAEYLEDVRTGYMGMPAAADRTRRVAVLLVRWRDWIDAQG